MIERKCFMCGTTMEKKIISTSAGWGKYKLTIDGIEAYVCPECNEIVYSQKEMHMIQRLGKSLANLSENNRPNLLNVKEVADLLRVSNQTVYNMIRDGRLNPVKVGREWRFMRKDIESIINGDDLHIAARGELSDNDLNIINKIFKEM